MNSANIDDPVGYFERLGGMHDADILLVTWDPKEKTICVSLDDLYSNSMGEPDYPGAEPAVIVFRGVVETDINIQNFNEVSRVYDVEIKQEEDLLNVRILCSPGGYVQCKCAEITLGDI